MGWSLNAGGVIMRTVRDLADEYNSEFFGPEYTGFYYKYSVVDNPNWQHLSYMNSIPLETSRGDTEPDEFSFNIPGYSGKFYLDEKRNWKVKCDKPVKVTFNGQFLPIPFVGPPGTWLYNHVNSPSFSGFTITTENGDQYVFGGSTSAIEYAIPFFEQNAAEWMAQSWYLTKIIHADGYAVNLNYEKDDFIDQLGLFVYMPLETRIVNSSGFFDPTPACRSTSFSSDLSSYINGKLISPSYLKSISGSNTVIVFNRLTSVELRNPRWAYDYRYSQWDAGGANYPGKGVAFLPFVTLNDPYPACLNKLQWKKLDAILIQDVSGNIKRSWQFNYNNDPNQRLMLRTLIEKGRDGGAKPPYQFLYDESKPFPPYFSNAVDHWGFYNNTFNDISDPDNFINTYYFTREPKEDVQRSGTLNKIIYPTGGVTEFIYEPNSYSKRLAVDKTNGIDPAYNNNTPAGGLRIKKISSYDPYNSTSATTKEYYYVSGYNNTLPEDQVKQLKSSGILGGQIKYYFDDYRTKASNDDDVSYSQKVFSSQSVLPASENSAGTHIGYSEVVEKLADGSYTKYFFTNFDNGHIDEPVPCIQLTRTPYEPASSLEAERGLLYKQESYNNKNVPVFRKETRYVALSKSNEFARGISLRSFGVCGTSGTFVKEGIAYKNYTYSYVPDQEVTTTYDANGGNPVETLRLLYYNEKYRQLSVVEEADSKKRGKVTYYRYPYDVLGYTPSANPTINEITAYMVQRNQIGSPIETVVTKTINGTHHVVDSKITTYNIFSGMVKPFRNYVFVANEPVAKSSYTNYLVAGYNGSEFVNIDSRMKMHR